MVIDNHNIIAAMTGMMLDDDDRQDIFYDVKQIIGKIAAVIAEHRQDGQQNANNGQGRESRWRNSK